MTFATAIIKRYRSREASVAESLIEMHRALSMEIEFETSQPPEAS